MVGRSLKNITMSINNSARTNSILRRSYYDNIRQVNIDIILGKPSWTTLNLNHSFKTLHTSGIMNTLWKTINNGYFGIIGVTGSRNQYVTEKRYTNRKIDNYFRTRPPGSFCMVTNRNIIYPGFKYNTVRDYGDIKEISGFEDEEMTIKDL